jgi:LuxR family maltose regulon positive regulatory protein
LEQALQSLHQAIILAVPEGYRRIFLEEGEPMKTLLEEYLRHPVGEEQSTWAACYHLASSLINDLGQKTLPVSNPVAEPQPTTSLVYPLFDPLSHRELEILQLMVAGKSTKEIASALMVSINTAKVHIKSIYRKTGAHTRPALLKRVKDLGLISVS